MKKSLVLILVFVLTLATISSFGSSLWRPYLKEVQNLELMAEAGEIIVGDYIHEKLSTYMFEHWMKAGTFSHPDCTIISNSENYFLINKAEGFFIQIKIDENREMAKFERVDRYAIEATLDISGLGA